MAIREYECQGCGKTIEINQPIAEEIKPEIQCPYCNAKAVKVISSFGFKLVGDGWPSQKFRRGME